MEWEWQPYTPSDPWQRSLQRSQARRHHLRLVQRLRRVGWGLFLALMVSAFFLQWAADGKSQQEAQKAVLSSRESQSAGGWLPAKTPYRNLILKAAKQTGMEPALLAGLVETESDFNSQELSSAGAYGLTQLMPESAQTVGVPWQGSEWQQLLGGAREFMLYKHQFGRTDLALAAYNAGAGAVSRYGGIPPYGETQAYVPRVLEYRKHYLPKDRG